MDNKKFKNKTDFKHPLFGISISNWIQILIYNRGFDFSYFSRAFFISLYSIFFLPTRVLFKILFNKKIKKTKIEKPPIFIIGHWRSGTTFLHELLSKDPNLCHVSLWHTLIPKSFLILEKVKPIMSKFLPKTRPMDAMNVDIDGPYEEEAGLAVLGKYSFFHCFYFPNNANRQFEKSVLFKGLSYTDMKRWRDDYLWLLKAVTFSNNNKQLILKNPANTARIKDLIEMFPKALFIHIYRNPYNVYFSTKKMRTNVLDMFSFQNTTEKNIESSVINNYKELMNSYFKNKQNVPKNQLVEISYENLVSNPMIIVEQIYKNLNFSDYEKAKPYVHEHLNQKVNYKSDKYKIDEITQKKIEHHWKFTIEKWNYKKP